MAGYDGYSMSNNARNAYDDGERPRSKWTKSAILDALEDEGVPKKRIEELKTLSAETLRDEVLTRTGWHHTSSYYNETDFYSVDPDLAMELDVSRFPKKPRRKRGEAEKEKDKGTEREAEYLIWSGTRKHPKATEHRSKGILRGNWFHLPDGSKKSIYGRGFRLIPEDELAASVREERQGEKARPHRQTVHIQKVEEMRSPAGRRNDRGGMG